MAFATKKCNGVLLTNERAQNLSRLLAFWSIIQNMLLLAFISTCILIEATPGPNMAYLAILSLNKGKIAGLSAVVGIAVGLLTIGVAAAIGVAVMISNSVFLYQLLRWCGVIYLLWLAWDGWKDSAGYDDAAKNVQRFSGKYFKRGLITNLLNPKAAIFYIAMLPNYINQEEHVKIQAITLTIAFVIVATFIHTAIVMLADRARQTIENPKKRLIISRTLAVLLAFVALWFAWSTR